MTKVLFSQHANYPAQRKVYQPSSVYPTLEDNPLGPGGTEGDSPLTPSTARDRLISHPTNAKGFERSAAQQQAANKVGKDNTQLTPTV